MDDAYIQRRSAMRHTEETRRKLSEARMGCANPFYGRTHTPETRARISESSRIRNLSRTYEPAPQRITIPGLTAVAYTAGMVDADGSIRFKTDRSTRQGVRRPFVTVYNTSRPLIEWLMNTYGHGCVANGNLGRDQVLSWTIQGARDVYALTTAIYPFLIVKRGDADLVLAFLREKYQWQ